MNSSIEESQSNIAPTTSKTQTSTIRLLLPASITNPSAPFTSSLPSTLPILHNFYPSNFGKFNTSSQQSFSSIHATQAQSIEKTRDATSIMTDHNLPETSYDNPHQIQFGFSSQNSTEYFNKENFKSHSRTRNPSSSPPISQKSISSKKSDLKLNSESASNDFTNSLETNQGSTLNQRLPRVRPESRLNSSISQVPKPKWHLGIRSRSSPKKILLEIYKALKNCGIVSK